MLVIEQKQLNFAKCTTCCCAFCKSNMLQITRILYIIYLTY